MAAVTVYAIAKLPERPGPRMNAAGVAAVIHQQNRREQMEAFRMWKDYVGGRRGLKPPMGSF